MNQLFKTGEHIVVLGTIFGKAGNSQVLPEHCIVVAEGEEDVLVELKTYESYSLYSSRRRIVPKICCIKLLQNPDVLFNSEILRPQVGDLILIQQGSLLDKAPTVVTGVIQGIRTSIREGERLSVFINGEMKSVSSDRVMVLQRHAKSLS